MLTSNIWKKIKLIFSLPFFLRAGQKLVLHQFGIIYIYLYIYHFFFYLSLLKYTFLSIISLKLIFLSSPFLLSILYFDYFLWCDIFPPQLSYIVTFKSTDVCSQIKLWYLTVPIMTALTILSTLTFPSKFSLSLQCYLLYV